MENSLLGPAVSAMYFFSDFNKVGQRYVIFVALVVATNRLREN